MQRGSAVRGGGVRIFHVGGRLVFCPAGSRSQPATHTAFRVSPPTSFAFAGALPVPVAIAIVGISRAPGTWFCIVVDLFVLVFEFQHILPNRRLGENNQFVGNIQIFMVPRHAIQEGRKRVPALV